MVATRLGFFIPPNIGPAKDTTNYCEGAELGTQGECCSPETWTNGGYGYLKGLQSVRYWNEARVRHATHILFDPPFVGSIDSSGLEALAYQVEAAPPLDLVERGRVAAVNFWQLFPKSRYRSNKKGVPTDCQTDGYYSVWVDDQPWSEERMAALERVTGWTLTSEERARLMKAQDSPGRINDWYAKAVGIIDTSPGSDPSFNVRTMPQIGDLVAVVPPSDPYGRATLAPGDWLRGFIDFFAAPQKKKVSAMKFKKKGDELVRVPLRAAVGAGVVERPSRGGLFAESEPPRDPDVPDTPRQRYGYGIALVGAALAAGAAWYWR